MRRTPSSGCYWGFVLCLRDTLYLFLAIAIIAYALRQIKFTQLLYFLYVSLYFLRNFYFCVFYTFFFFFLIIYSAYWHLYVSYDKLFKELTKKGRIFLWTNSSVSVFLSPWWSFNGDTSGSARTYYGSWFFTNKKAKDCKILCFFYYILFKESSMNTKKYFITLFSLISLVTSAATPSFTESQSYLTHFLLASLTRSG